MNVKKGFFKYIFTIVFAVLFLCSTAVAVRFGIQSRHFRELSDRCRIELATAVDTNTELGEQLATSRRIVEACRGTTAELGESVNRNISTAREAIELVREIREKVILLESRLDSSDNNLSNNSGDTPSSEVEQYGKSKS